MKPPIDADESWRPDSFEGLELQRSVLVGAGDRDRTGDIQLGKPGHQLKTINIAFPDISFWQ
jgi:hypothetical protein